MISLFSFHLHFYLPVIRTETPALYLRPYSLLRQAKQRLISNNIVLQFSTPWNFRCIFFSFTRVGKENRKNTEGEAGGKKCQRVRGRLLDNAGGKRWHLGNTILGQSSQAPKALSLYTTSRLSNFSIRKVLFIQVITYEENCNNCLKKIGQQNLQKPGKLHSILPLPLLLHSIGHATIEWW